MTYEGFYGRSWNKVMKFNIEFHRNMESSPLHEILKITGTYPQPFQFL